eukprot:428699-Rhodomonas_salina.3
MHSIAIIKLWMTSQSHYPTDATARRRGSRRRCSANATLSADDTAAIRDGAMPGTVPHCTSHITSSEACEKMQRGSKCHAD